MTSYTIVALEAEYTNFMFFFFICVKISIILKNHMCKTVDMLQWNMFDICHNYNNDILLSKFSYYSSNTLRLGERLIYAVG